METSKRISQKVLQIISDLLAIDKNKLNSNDSFSDDLGVDSLDVNVLIMTIEKDFKFKFDEDEVERLTTVGALINKVIEKVPYLEKHDKAEVFEMQDIIAGEAKIA